MSQTSTKHNERERKRRKKKGRKKEIERDRETKRRESIYIFYIFASGDSPALSIGAAAFRIVLIIFAPLSPFLSELLIHRTASSKRARERDVWRNESSICWRNILLKN
jgi:hypothetical protein